MSQFTPKTKTTKTSCNYLSRSVAITETHKQTVPSISWLLLSGSRHFRCFAAIPSFLFPLSLHLNGHARLRLSSFRNIHCLFMQSKGFGIAETISSASKYCSSTTPSCALYQRNRLHSAGSVPATMVLPFFLQPLLLIAYYQSRVTQSLKSWFHRYNDQ